MLFEGIRQDPILPCWQFSREGDLHPFWGNSLPSFFQTQFRGLRGQLLRTGETRERDRFDLHICISHKGFHRHWISIRRRVAGKVRCNWLYLLSSPLFFYYFCLCRVTEIGNFSESDARTIVCQILKGVEYLHSKNIVHRDLKVWPFASHPSTPHRVRSCSWFVKLWFVIPAFVQAANLGNAECWMFGTLRAVGEHLTVQQNILSHSENCWLRSRKVFFAHLSPFETRCFQEDHSAKVSSIY